MSELLTFGAIYAGVGVIAYYALKFICISSDLI